MWRLTWPVLLANLTIPMVGVTDTWIMGRSAGPDNIAAVALGSIMFSAFYWLFGFLRMGTTAQVAQAFGALSLQGPQAIAAIAARAATIALLLGSTMVLVQIPLQSLLFVLFEPPATIFDLTDTYFDIRIWSAPALLVYLVCMGVLFGMQRMRDTLWLSIGFTFANLLLDIWFALLLNMGVAGVAWGTLISEWGAAVLGVVLVVRALLSNGWQPAQPPDLWRYDHTKALFNLSGNLILRTFCVQLPFLVGTKLATDIDTTTLALHGVLMQLFFIMTYGLDAFAYTAESLSGYGYGARRAEWVHAATRYCSIWALLIAVVTALFYALAGEQLVAWFTQAETVRAMAPTYLPWVAFAPLVCIWAFLLDGVFIGTTHISEMRNAMFAAVLLWAAALWLTFDSLAYHGVWLAMITFMLARGLLLALLYPRVGRSLA